MKQLGPFVAPAVLGWTLVLWPFSAEAASLVTTPGFLAGSVDGFLALLKLLISPFASVSIVDPDAAGWHYHAGYCTGVLVFAATAGMAAFEADPGEQELVGLKAEVSQSAARLQALMIRGSRSG